MDFLNVCYKFFNRFITSYELVEKLEELKESNNDIEKIINEVWEIIRTTSNDEDEYVNREKQIIKKFIDKLDNSNDEMISKEVENLKKQYNRKKDSYDRWFKITDYINENEYFNREFDNLSDYELLEFISQYIQAPFPPKLSQEEFDRLVTVGIENDEREWLWRLAFNYENSDINIDKIANYYIDINDGYYLSELISVVFKKLNIEDILNKINNKELINDLLNRRSVLEHFITEEQFDMLYNKIK